MLRTMRKLARVSACIALLLWPAALLSQQPSPPPPPPPADHERAKVGGPSLDDGTEVTVHLPESQHVKNIGAPADGLGLCVFASMDMAARWHNVTELEGIIGKIREGGGWPEKVDQVLGLHAPNLDYVQYEGANPAILDQAMAENRAACVTYGYGERYGGKTIYHMVLLVHLDDKVACILDNNFPGANNLEWMTRREFLRRWMHPHGQGWAFVLLAPPPPPIPTN